jgi:hypothetical protein
MSAFKAQALFLTLAAVTLTCAAAEAVTLIPHRATYELALDPSKTSMKLDRATGRIAFELMGNACEGYSVTLRQVTGLDTGEGRLSTSDLHSVSWEDGAAKSYRFKSRNVLNDELRDQVDGTAERKADGGFTVKLGGAKPEAIVLNGKIALPTQHLISLIAAGAAGQRIVETKVFDGAPDGRKVYDTLAVVGPAVKDEQPSEDAAKKTELTSSQRYPVTVSYFEPGVGERTPTYVLGFELYDNGVSRALRLDYGGFALRGELSSIEFLKSTPCKR